MATFKVNISCSWKIFLHSLKPAVFLLLYLPEGHHEDVHIWAVSYISDCILGSAFQLEPGGVPLLGVGISSLFHVGLLRKLSLSTSHCLKELAHDLKVYWYTLLLP